MATGDNERFVRIWWEVKFSKLGLRIKNNNEAWQCLLKWFPFNKGGSYRKWYGNQEHVINFSIENYKILKNMGNHCPSEEFYFKPAVSWSKVTSGHFSVRYYPTGFIFADAGMSIFSDSHSHLHGILKELNSNFSKQFYEAISPTLNYEVGIIRQIPYVETSFALSKKFIEISKIDWDSFEGSWDFVGSPLLAAKRESVKLAFAAWQAENAAAVAEMQRLEEENNRLFIDAYGLQDELTPAVPLEQITLTVNPRYRYGGNATPAELEQRFQSDTCAELISYAIGCMMGRYRLDKPGLIYAHAGNVDFQTIYGEHAAFPPTTTALSPSLTKNGSPTTPPTASANSCAWSGVKRACKRTSISWRKASPNTPSNPNATKAASTPSAATCRRSSTKTTCAPTKNARSTGYSAPASTKRLNASSTCTATTQAHSHGCAPNTSPPCSANTATTPRNSNNKKPLPTPPPRKAA